MEKNTEIHTDSFKRKTMTSSLFKGRVEKPTSVYVVKFNLYNVYSVALSLSAS